MMNKTVPLEYGRVYLFTAPARISATVNHDLLVVFSLPKHKSAGAILFNLESPVHELNSLLEMMFDKLTVDLNFPQKDLSLKLIGLSNPEVPVLRCAHAWAKEKQIDISAEDLGRRVTRNIIIDCETGRVGVAYAEAAMPKLSGFLDSRSANRRNESMARYSIMILGVNKVKRQLCRQAVEEKEIYSADCPTKPYDVFTKGFENFVSDAVLICGDIGNGKPVEKWVKAVRANRPNLPVLWIGKDSPKNLALEHSLSEPQPESMTRFKKELHQLLHKTVENAPHPSLVLPFKKKA